MTELAIPEVSEEESDILHSFMDCIQTNLNYFQTKGSGLQTSG